MKQHSKLPTSALLLRVSDAPVRCAVQGISCEASRRGPALSDSTSVAVDTDRKACRDWMGKYRGKSQLLLRPKSTHQVSDLLKYCNERRLAVVPQVRYNGSEHNESRAAAAFVVL